MKDKEIENPPAFPKAAFYHEHGGSDSPQEGMTLRDYLAAKAMQGIITALMSPTGFKNAEPESIASESYKVADAMLKERSKSA